MFYVWFERRARNATITWIVDFLHRIFSFSTFFSSSSIATYGFCSTLTLESLLCLTVFGFFSVSLSLCLSHCWCCLYCLLFIFPSGCFCCCRNVFILWNLQLNNCIFSNFNRRVLCAYRRKKVYQTKSRDPSHATHTFNFHFVGSSKYVKSFVFFDASNSAAIHTWFSEI